MRSMQELQSSCSAGDSMQYACYSLHNSVMSADTHCPDLLSVRSGLFLRGLEAKGCRDKRVYGAHF